MNAQSTDAELQARVERVFREVFPPTITFGPELDRAHEAEWTSLLHVEFLIALEREFGVRFDGADATDMSTMSDVIARLHEKLA